MQILILLTLLGMFLPVPAFCYDILLLQSLDDRGYNEAVRGFKKECSASSRTVVLSEYPLADVIRMAREEHPKIIVAVGERALDVASKVRDIPVLYMMVLSLRQRYGPNQSGVTMWVDPSRYLAVFENGHAKRVGLLYDPNRSGNYVRKAQSAAKRFGIDIVAREVRSPKETPAMLDSLRGKVDALWMVPDLTAVSSETTEAYFLFSQGEMVPVITFSDVYLPMGGAVAVNIDRFDIGRQVGEMALSILGGTPVEDIAPQTARKSTLKWNAVVLRKLKFVLNGAGG